jgi:hypothetical protein
LGRLVKTHRHLQWWGARDLAVEIEAADKGRGANGIEKLSLVSLFAPVQQVHLFMKTLQTVNAVIELGAGLALLCFPSTTVALLLGSPLDTSTDLTVARVGGAGLFALGAACWLARCDSQSPAARGLVAAMLLYDVAAVAVLAFAGVGFGLHGVALWPAVLVHAVMTVWCVACLRRSPLNMTRDKNS